MKKFNLIHAGRTLSPNELSTVEGGNPILCTDNDTYLSCTDAFSYKICSPTPSLTGYASDGRIEFCTKGYEYRTSDHPVICGIQTSYTKTTIP